MMMSTSSTATTKPPMDPTITVTGSVWAAAVEGIIAEGVVLATETVIVEIMVIGTEVAVMDSSIDGGVKSIA